MAKSYAKVLTDILKDEEEFSMDCTKDGRVCVRSDRGE